MNTIGQKRLGKSELVVPALGTGAASWGETFMGYGKSYAKEDIVQAYHTCLDAGINFFDTAPGYGRGESERILGECRRKDGRPIIISTKYAPPNVFHPSLKQPPPRDLMKSLDNSLQRLGVEQIDLFTLHFPPRRRLLDEYMDVLAEAVQAGKVRAVGVSNFKEPLLRQAHARLARHGIPLASTQAAYNLLQRYPEDNGVLDACRELNVALIATGPLAQGVLTGKHRSEKRSLTLFQRTIAQLTRIDWFGEMNGAESFFKRLFTKPRSLQCEQLEPVFKVLEEIARIYGKTIPQVALNWLMTTDPGVIPIPGAKNARQAGENAGALGFRLTEEEHRRISQAEIASR